MGALPIRKIRANTVYLVCEGAQKAMGWQDKSLNEQEAATDPEGGRTRAEV